MSALNSEQNTQQASAKTIGQRLKELRRQNGWEQKELSLQSGVPLQTIKDIERGKTITPRSKTLKPLAGALKVTTGFLVSGQGPPEQ
ncbi:MAG TPA: helix-turn-helix transcriptional regulator [Abditibacteriaceae bacterium]